MFSLDKKKIEYLLIAIAIFLLVYASYFFLTYNYQEQELTIDSIKLLSPVSSEYAVEGDTIVFTNQMNIYNLNITKANSSDKKVVNIINYYSNFKEGSVEYRNESYYLLTAMYDNEGCKYHSILIPIDSFDKDTLSFTNETTVWVFDGNNKEFVMDSAFNSEVAA